MSPASTGPGLQISAAEVCQELQRILQSQTFSSAKRLSSFLRYVVTAALDGSEIKESVIAVEVYDRQASYDPKVDSIVRVEASRLRSKLREYYESEGKDNPLRIELPKGGYQPAFRSMVAERTPPPETDSSQRTWFALAALIPLGAVAFWWYGPAASRTAAKSISVAPMVIASGDRAVESLGASLSNGLRDALIRSGQWKVSTLTSVAEISGRSQPARVGTSSAEVVLTGNLTSRERDTVQLELQLVNAADGYLLWTGSFADRVGALIESQKDFADRVVEQVTQKFAGLPPPPRSAHYSRARELLSIGTPEAIKESIRLFETAIQSDPRFSPAWAGLARAHLLMLDLAPELDTRERLEAARAAARKALDLDESNAEAHAELGGIYLDRDWNFQQAVPELHRAFTLDPVSITPAVLYARALTMVGSLSTASEAIAIARSRYPSVPDILFQEGSVYFLGHKFEKVEAIGRELMTVQPTRGNGHWLVGLSLEQRGRVREAISTFEAGLRQIARDDHRIICALAHSYALTGDRPMAIATVSRFADLKSKKVTRYSLPYCAAMTFAALNELDTAFDWLDKAAMVKDNSFPFLPYDPRFDKIRNDPRYLRLVATLRER